MLVSSGCKPAPEPPAPPAVPPLPMASPASVVPIPDEFFTSAPAPTPVKPVLPRVVFATSDFQVTTDNGIQGIRAGEALDFVREDGGDFVVRHGKLEFRKNQSYFASTYEEPARPEPTPLAGENAPVATMEEPALPDEPPLSGVVPPNDPALVAETKKVGELTESLRKLNEQIRTAQDDLNSQRPAGAASPAPQETKKAARAIEKLKAQRDVLSGQLTEMGKP